MRNIAFSEILFKYERILFVLMGVFLVFLSWFFIIPKTREVFEAKTALSQEKNRLSKLGAKLQDLESLNEFELSERTNLSLKAIPDKKNVIGVMTSLRTQAAEEGLTIESLSVSPGELVSTGSAKASLGKLDFKLEIQGSLEKVLGFFKKIQESLPLVSLKKVKIEFSGENATVELTLESYFLPLPQTLGVIDSPVPKLTSDEEKILTQISKFSYLPPVSFPPGTGRTNPFSF
ncbi:MAG: type 4a pilus biogenesis protein PilO [Patescibacteria group bacterium]